MLAKKNAYGTHWFDSEEKIAVPMNVTACPCCGKNEIQQEVIDFYALIFRFIDLHTVDITSGYRCKKHNKEVGGAADSAHVKGMALDISNFDNLPALYAAAEMASKLFPGGTGIGYYPKGHGNIIHIDRRLVSARWLKLDKYQNFTMALKQEYLK